MHVTLQAARDITNGNVVQFSPGHALEVGVRRKLTTHLQACRSIGVNFIPIWPKH